MEGQLKKDLFWLFCTPMMVPTSGQSTATATIASANAYRAVHVYVASRSRGSKIVNSRVPPEKDCFESFPTRFLLQHHPVLLDNESGKNTNSLQIFSLFLVQLDSWIPI